MVIRNKLYTIDDFERFIALRENRDRRFELIYGEIVEKMPTEQHGLIGGNVHGPLWAFVKQAKLGRVGFEIRYGVRTHKYNTRIPDISFSSDTDTPIVVKGAVPKMPDLAVEIQSPDDDRREMREKAAYYIQHGSRLVWLVYTDEPGVDECKLGKDGEMQITHFGLDDTLDGGDVLPGFKLSVRDIFDI